MDSTKDLFGNFPTYLTVVDRRIEVKYRTQTGWDEKYFNLTTGKVIGVSEGTPGKWSRDAHLIIYNIGSLTISFRDLNTIGERYPEIAYVSKRLPDLLKEPIVNDSGAKVYYLQTGFVPVIYDLIENRIKYKFEPLESKDQPITYFFLGDNYIVLFYNDDIIVQDIRYGNEMTEKSLLFEGGYAPERLGFNSFIFIDTKEDALKIVKLGYTLSDFKIQNLTYNGEKVENSDSIIVYPLGDKYIIRNFIDDHERTLFWIYDPIKNSVKEYTDEITIHFDSDENNLRYKITPLKKERVVIVKKMADVLGGLLKISDDLAKVVCEYAVY